MSKKSGDWIGLAPVCQSDGIQSFWRLACIHPSESSPGPERAVGLEPKCGIGSEGDVHPISVGRKTPGFEETVGALDTFRIISPHPQTAVRLQADRLKI